MSDLPDRNGQPAADHAEGGLASQETTESLPLGIARRGDRLSLEQASKLGVIIAGVVYLFGLFAMNLYLAQLGVGDYSLLRTQYLFTGALILLPVIALFGSWQLAVYQLFFDQPRWIKLLNFGFWFLVPFALGVWLEWGNPALAGLGRLSSTIQLWLTTLPVATFGFGFVVLMLGHVPFQPKHRPVARITPSHTYVRLIWVWAFAVAFAVSLAWYSNLFVTRIFPFIPPQFGGGRAVRIVLLLSEVAPDVNNASSTSPAKKQALKVDLLFETSEYIVVRYPNGRIVTISRRLVDAIVVVK